MRKLAAIALLSIFTFNMMGYHLVYNYEANRSDAALEVALDAKEYSDDELISIKQPTNLPYYNSTEAFQRIDGEVEIDGVKYKYVKCRIYQGSLEMLCIPNKAKMKIEQSKNDYAKFAHDFQLDNNKEKKSGSKASQKQLSEYEELPTFNLQTGFIQINSFFVVNTRIANKHHFNTAEQPPDAARA